MCTKQYSLDDPRYPQCYLDTSKIPAEKLAKAMYDYTRDNYLIALRSKRRSICDDVTRINDCATSQDFFMSIENLDKSNLFRYSSYIQEVAKSLQLTASIIRGLAYTIPELPKETDIHNA